MDDSKKKGYIAGVVSWIISVVLFALAINVGWNLSGQVMGVFGLAFCFLGSGSFWKPETIGDLTAQILDNLGKNMAEQESGEHSKKGQNVHQVVNNYGNMSNAVGSGNKLDTYGPNTSQKREEYDLDEEEYNKDYDYEATGVCPYCDEEYDLSEREIKILEKDGEIKIKCPACHKKIVVDEEDLK